VVLQRVPFWPVQGRGQGCEVKKKVFKARIISEAQRRWMGQQKEVIDKNLEAPEKVPGLKFWKRGSEVIFERKKK